MIKWFVDIRRWSIISLTVLLLLSCSNSENDFPDFDYTVGYFPYQYPVRILVLGNYIYDNSNDNQHKFVISSTIGGLHKNSTERVVNFVVDESLCDNLFFDDDNPILPLPESYYTLSNTENIIIPAGEMSGGVEIQLNDKFFNDKDAIRNKYVVPLRITSVENLDTFLIDKSFTLFAVKFVNPFHGSYLRYGHATTLKDNGELASDSVYKTTYMEQNEVLSLSTTGRTTITMRTSSKSQQITGLYDLKITFESDNFDSQESINCEISSTEGVPYNVSGSGKYIANNEKFGGKQRDAIYLQYTIEKDDFIYLAKDTLVFRDKGVNLETYNPILKN